MQIFFSLHSIHILVVGSLLKHSFKTLTSTDYQLLGTVVDTFSMNDITKVPIISVSHCLNNNGSLKLWIVFYTFYIPFYYHFLY